MRWLALLLALLATPASADLFGPPPAVVSRLANAGQASASAPSIDGTSTIGVTTGTTLVLTITTTQTNDTLVVMGQTSGNSVSSVAGCSLTWTARTIQGTATNMYEYTAPAPSTVTGCSVTITYNFTNADTGVVFGIHGNGTTSPSADVNASLPQGSTATTTTYSTTNAADIILCFYNAGGSTTPTTPSGFTAITPAANNSNMSYQIASSVQSGTVVTPPTTPPNQTIIDAFKD